MDREAVLLDTLFTILEQGLGFREGFSTLLRSIEKPEIDIPQMFEEDVELVVWLKRLLAESAPDEKKKAVLLSLMPDNRVERFSTVEMEAFFFDVSQFAVLMSDSDSLEYSQLESYRGKSIVLSRLSIIFEQVDSLGGNWGISETFSFACTVLWLTDALREVAPAWNRFTPVAVCDGCNCVALGVLCDSGWIAGEKAIRSVLNDNGVSTGSR